MGRAARPWGTRVAHEGRVARWALLAVLMAVACNESGGRVVDGTDGAGTPADSRDALGIDPPALASLGSAREGEFTPTTAGGARACTVGADLCASLDAAGTAQITAPSTTPLATLRLGLHSVRRDGWWLPEPAVLGPIALAGHEARLVREHGIEEWYAAGHGGIEHGFVVREPLGLDPADRASALPPARSPRGRSLVFAVSLGAAASVELVAGGDELRIGQPGEPAWRYGKLAAYDAHGRELPSWMTLEPGRVLLHVDDAGAAYPLVIDPLVWVEGQKMVPSTGASAYDEFGASIALSGDLAIVGACGDDEMGAESGSAYVFLRSGTSWALEQELLAPDGAAGDRFGCAVAIDAETALVGAYGHGDAGAAYVFVRSGTTWSLEQSIEANDGLAGDQFGQAVALSGDTALVGAWGADDQGADAGAAYVFYRSGTTWNAQQKLVADAGADQDFFGSAVALDGETALVGAYGDDEQGSDAGAAYVFVRVGASWSVEQKLRASDGAPVDELGASVALSGDTALLGAPRHNAAAAPDAGAGYVFARAGSTWTEQDKLTTSPGETLAFVGWSVALHEVDASAATAVLGAWGRDSLGTDQGSALVFVRSTGTWSASQELLASDAANSDYFGIVSALDGDTAFVAASAEDDAGTNAGAVYAFERAAGTFTQQQKLVMAEGGTSDGFGIAVDVDATTALAVAGAYFDDDRGVNAGAAYVFSRSGESWVEEQKLTPADGADEDRFGRMVALSGETVLVGSYQHDGPAAESNVGAAYVYARESGSWPLEQKLTAPVGDAQATDQFGVAVALDADTALVGAHGDDETASNAGAAYVFVRAGTTWSLEQKLRPADGLAGDLFGFAVAVDGNRALVGAYGDDDPSAGSNAGSAYVFVRSAASWTQEQKLTAGDGAVDDYFGYAVALAGDVAVVGAYGDDDSVLGTTVGSAYVFLRSGSTWSLAQKLVASDALAEDRFGLAVATTTTRVIVGSYLHDALGSNAGAVYSFARSGATFSGEQKLVGFDTAASDNFGRAVGVDDALLLVGSPNDDDCDTNCGAAYPFDLRSTLGESCTTGADCESSYCTDDVCCALAECPACQSCDLAGHLGACMPDASLVGSTCGSSAATECSDSDTCDGAGVCQPNHRPAATSCGDPTPSECSAADSCDDWGNCQPNHAAADTACGDATESDCTHADRCDGDGTCLPYHEPDGTPCLGGSCEQGVCVTGAGGQGTGGGSGGASTGGDGGATAGAGPGPAAPAAEDDGGCGCRAAGQSRGRGLGWLLFVAAALWRRPRGKSRRLSSMAVGATAALGLAAAGGASGCSCESDETTVPVGQGGTAVGGGVPGGGGAGGAAGSGGGACASGIVCGPFSECCLEGEECVGQQCLPACPLPRVRCGAELAECCAEGDECLGNVCVPACPAPRERCGEAGDVCCADDEVCIGTTCVVPGVACSSPSDCEEDEYCEPVLEICLPDSTLPQCEYHPPIGELAPQVEWSYGPTTAPYARAEVDAAFVDVCASGTPIAFPDPDESLAVVALGALEVPFFDLPRGEMTVSTNGWLTFEPGYVGTPAPVNTSLPDPSGPNLVVAPYWDDLVNVTGCLLLDATGSRVVVQWRGQVAGSSEVLLFQVVMNAAGHALAGDLHFYYGQLGPAQDGDGATVGIEDAATARGIVHSMDRTGAVSTSRGLEFHYVPLHNHFDALTPPAVFDLDHDGKPEVMLAAYDDTPVAYSGVANQFPIGLQGGVLTILNGEDGTIQARVEDPDAYIAAGAALSVGDIDGDGDPEIIGVGGSYEDVVLSSQDTAFTAIPTYIKAFEPDGTLKWVSDAPVGFNYNGWGGGVHLADLEGFGTPEIIFGLAVFDYTGHLLWSEPNESGTPTTNAADLDGDLAGDLEIVSDRSAWHHDHSLLWSRPDLTGYAFPSVADFDGNGTPEVAMVGGGRLIIVNGLDGSTFWGPVLLGTDGGGPLNIGDFDGDGSPEIGTAGEGAYIVFDLQCTGDPLPAGCSAEGIRWAKATKDISSNVTGSSLFDFEGDGIAEVVYSDECFTRVYRGLDGMVQFETPVNTRTATEYPLVADVDGDNNAEILIVANESVPSCFLFPWNVGELGTPWVEAPYPPPFCSPGVFCAYRGIFVYGDSLDNWVRTRPVWSGHAYHISNIESDGTIPAPEPASWLDHNSFRMNAQGKGLFYAPDLTIELTADQASCPVKLVLRATVSNDGAVGVPAGLPVSFYIASGPDDWECLGTVSTGFDLLPWASTEVTLDYPIAAEQIDQSLEFRAVVDADCDGQGVHNECETGGEDNNEALAEGLCHGYVPR